MVTVAELSETSIFFGRVNTELVISNPTLGIDMFTSVFFPVFVLSCLDKHHVMGQSYV
jgi:hypothetical protein